MTDGATPESRDPDDQRRGFSSNPQVSHGSGGSPSSSMSLLASGAGGYGVRTFECRTTDSRSFGRKAQALALFRTMNLWPRCSGNVGLPLRQSMIYNREIDVSMPQIYMPSWDGQAEDQTPLWCIFQPHGEILTTPRLQPRHARWRSRPCDKR